MIHLFKKEQDFQKQKVYRWQEKLLNRKDFPLLSPEQCNTFVESVWWDYRNDAPPTVVFTGLQPFARGCREYLEIPYWAKSKLFLLHELAHSFLDDGHILGHGPTFVGLFSEMLVKYADFKDEELKKSLGKAGIRYA